MPTCYLYNKVFGMITESYMKKCHAISCKDYVKSFALGKGGKP